MDRDRLLTAIRQYCVNNGFTKTAKKIPAPNIKLEDCDDIEILFTKYLKTENVDSKPKSGLGFKINLDWRKRIRAVDITEEKVKSKKPKKVKVKKEKLTDDGKEIPEQFLLLLDELRLDRKDAKLLFENREHWAYVKSDRQIFCVEQGMFIFGHIQYDNRC